MKTHVDVNINKSRRSCARNA